MQAKAKLNGYQRQQIAVKAVVSESSVRRWERNPGRLRSTVRTRIEQAVQELGLLRSAA